MRNSIRLGVLFCAFVLTTAVGARGAIILNAGDTLLNKNQANQAIPIMVSGGDQIQGVSLEVQIGDGFNFAGLPKITSVDLFTGTIFATNNTGQSGSGFAYPGIPTFYEASTTTATGTVTANGLLATVYVDTTGLFEGNWALKLMGTRNLDTDFVIPATITNGSVQVPEPTMAMLLAVAAPMLLRRRRAA